MSGQIKHFLMSGNTKSASALINLYIRAKLAEDTRLYTKLSQAATGLLLYKVYSKETNNSIFEKSHV